jgi:hypothetical protein
MISLLEMSEERFFEPAAARKRMRGRRAAVLAHFVKDTKRHPCVYLYLGTGIAFAKAVAEFFSRSRTLVNIMVNFPTEETCEQLPAGFG